MHEIMYYHLKDCDELNVSILKPKETTIIIKQRVIANKLTNTIVFME